MWQPGHHMRSERLGELLAPIAYCPISWACLKHHSPLSWGWNWAYSTIGSFLLHSRMASPKDTYNYVFLWNFC